MSEQVTEAGHHASKVRAFLAAIRTCPSITRAARSADIRPGMHYRRMKTDAVYKAAFEEAWASGVQALEDFAMERAQLGWEEPVIFQGELQYPLVRGKDGKMGRSKTPLTIRKHSDSMTQFMLRGAKPEKYRERHQHNVDVTDKRFSGPLEQLLATYRKLTTDERE